MAHNAKLAIAALLALIGLALAAAGLWLAMRVGPSGAASFTARPAAQGAVVLTPAVLNALEGDVLVTARSTQGGTVWLGRARASEAELVIGDAARVTTSGYDVTKGALTLKKVGEGDLPALATADVWRSTESAKGTASIRISQEDAPESVVITSDLGQLARVTVTVERRAWFAQAVVAMVIALLLVGGAIALWRLSKPAPTPTEESDASEPDVKTASDGEPEATESDDTEPGEGEPDDPAESAPQAETTDDDATEETR